MGALRNQLYSAMCGYLGAVSFGYVIGYSSPALPQMTIFQQDDAGASWFGSIVTLGASSAVSLRVGLCSVAAEGPQCLLRQFPTFPAGC